MFKTSSYVCSLTYLVLSLVICTSATEPIHHVHHIFNAIHSSMRQWGSSLNHNGVSFFRAEVPRGVQLHHGTRQPDRVLGMEWLAFEPEHALHFAVRLCDAHEESVPEEFRNMSPRWWPRQAVKSHFPHLKSGQEIIAELPPKPRPPPPSCFEPGWMHTYAPTRDLKLLYIDGTSAGITHHGTLDSQGHVLLWNKSKGLDPLDEPERARGLCELAQDEFQGEIDGFIRMEHGFEIILCDFSLLEVVSILRSTRSPMLPGPVLGYDLEGLRAIVSRYFGIGGHRVRVDYDNFVTAFNHPEIELWPDGGEQPRLNKISNATASALVNEVKQMVLSDHKPIEEQVDWQSIADLYVERYSQPILRLISSTFDTAEAVHKEIQRIFQPYMDRTLADWNANIKRCQNAFIPIHLVNHPNPSLAQQVIEQEAYHLCSSLHTILTDGNVLELQKNHLQTLMDSLNWTMWKYCQPGCAIDEMCFTAIWPFGTQEDHDRPSCMNTSGISGRYGYWD